MLHTVNGLYPHHFLFAQATLACSCSLNLPGSVLRSLSGVAQAFSRMEALSMSLLVSDLPDCLLSITLTSKLSQVSKPFAMAQLHLPGTAWVSLLNCFRGTFWILYSFRCCNIFIHIMRRLGMKTKPKHEIHLCITYAYLKCYIIFLV